MNNRWIIVLLFLIAQSAFTGELEAVNFDQFINNDTSGASFEEAVILPDRCDYSKCKTRDCLQDVFDATVFGQELKYTVDNYGVRGKDWDVSGYDEVDSYIFDDDRYYDDLGVEIMGTKENRVLHFDITASANAFRGKEFSF